MRSAAIVPDVGHINLSRKNTCSTEFEPMGRQRQIGVKDLADPPSIQWGENMERCAHGRCTSGVFGGDGAPPKRP